ncbi:HNH endonuclease [Brevundimonas phage vB_BpoS-Poludnitsa]|nr:HNH endonuclease [Brevundimonas phage vB_BpoS-Poludnitsa]
MEVWRDIPTWEGSYQVSNEGRVRSVTRVIPASRGSGTRTMQGKVLAATVRKAGYPVVDLTAPGGRRESRYVHHLVLLVFVGPRPADCPEIRHRNGIKTDCALTNLVYGTHAENAADRAAHGQQGGGGVSRKLTPDQIDECRFLSLTLSNRQLAQKFGVSHTTMNGYLQ